MCSTDIVPVSGAIKKYAWGKIGKESEVFNLFLSQTTWAEKRGHVYNQPPLSLPEDEESPFAELWITTHPSGPALVLNEENKLPHKDIMLQDWLKDKQEALGRTQSHFNNNQHHLPYIVKVLSIKKILSIQAHPDKKLAQQLHQQDPAHYPDANHKPEMAIALTSFEAFCGFREISQLVLMFEEVPELEGVVGKEIMNEFKQKAKAANTLSPEDIKKVVKEVFSALMMNEEEGKRAVSEMEKRFLSLDYSPSKNEIVQVAESLARRVMNFFPGDTGILAIFFLNYVKMEPLEGLFLGPNEPHAYLSGDIVEITACSDNVVRAGCTPKFRDKSTLLSMLNYKTGFPEGFMKGKTLFSGESQGASLTHKLYQPPIPEFQVDLFEINSSSSFSSTSFSFTLPSIDAGSLWLVLEGEGILSSSSSPSSSCQIIYSAPSPPFSPSASSFELQKGASFFLASGGGVVAQTKNAGGLVLCRTTESAMR